MLVSPQDSLSSTYASQQNWREGDMCEEEYVQLALNMHARIETCMHKNVPLMVSIMHILVLGSVWGQSAARPATNQKKTEAAVHQISEIYRCSHRY